MSTTKKKSGGGGGGGPAAMPNQDILGALSVPPPASYATTSNESSTGAAAATATAAAGPYGDEGYGGYSSYGDDDYNVDYGYNYDYNGGYGDEYGSNEKYLKATAAASGKKKKKSGKSSGSSAKGAAKSKSISAVAAASDSTNEKPKKELKIDSNGVIEIDSDSDDDDGEKIVGSSGTKKRKRTRKKPPPSSNDPGYAERIKDAIDVDEDDDDTNDDGGGKISSKSKEELKLASYRKSLGPLRMIFLPSLKNHSFVNGVPNSSHYSYGGRGAGRGSGSGGRGGRGVRGGRGSASTTNNSSTVKIRKLHREYVEYALNLPAIPQGAIFCRVDESRLDLCRVLMTGPEDTPYANGCFLFDFWMEDYPVKAPKAKFLTTGGGTVRFNPNLYNCGKVCLSLLGTWSGPGWVSNQSTLLQVLVSIQGLILVPEPFFNEPGYERSRGTPNGKKQSDQYNKNIRLQTLRWAILDPLIKAMNYLEHGGEKNIATTAGASKKKSAPKMGPAPSTSCSSEYQEFPSVVIKHFYQKADDVESQLKDWIKLDKSVKTVADQIRSSMKRLLEKDEKEWEQIASNRATATLMGNVSPDEQASVAASVATATATAAKKKSAPSESKTKKTENKQSSTVDLTGEEGGGDDGGGKPASKNTAEPEIIEIL